MKKTIFDPRYEKLTAFLKQERRAKGFTMREISQKLGCSYSFIGKYERNEVRLDVLQYFEICLILKIDPTEGLKNLVLRNKNKSSEPS